MRLRRLLVVEAAGVGDRTPERDEQEECEAEFVPLCSGLVVRMLS